MAALHPLQLRHPSPPWVAAGQQWQRRRDAPASASCQGPWSKPAGPETAVKKSKINCWTCWLLLFWLKTMKRTCWAGGEHGMRTWKHVAGANPNCCSLGSWNVQVEIPLPSSCWCMLSSHPFCAQHVLEDLGGYRLFVFILLQQVVLTSSFYNLQDMWQCELHRGCKTTKTSE